MLIKRKKTKIAMRECKISKVCKKLPQLNSKKPINPVKKWAKDWNRHFAHSLLTQIFSKAACSVVKLAWGHPGMVRDSAWPFPHLTACLSLCL
jgi:hypothetical protein